VLCSVFLFCVVLWQVSVPSVCSHGVVAFAPPDRLLDAITTTLPIYLVAYTINFQVGHYTTHMLG
jgi:hypothetical protein